MQQKATALIVLTSFLFWTSGCAAHKMVQQPAGEYVTNPPSPSQTVRVRAVLTKSGEKVEFPGDNLALLIGDRVMSFEKEAKLITVDRSDAALTTRGTETVSVRVKNRTYESVLVVAETAQSVTFVAGATPLGREIPLAEIDQLWVQKKGVNTATKVGIGVLIAGGILFGILAMMLATDLPP
jgi:hypothetical protein